MPAQMSAKWLPMYSSKVMMPPLMAAMPKCAGVFTAFAGALVEALFASLSHWSPLGPSISCGDTVAVPVTGKPFTT